MNALKTIVHGITDHEQSKRLLPSVNGTFIEAMNASFMPHGADLAPSPAIFHSDSALLPSGHELHIEISDEHNEALGLDRRTTVYTHLDQYGIQRSVAFARTALTGTTLLHEIPNVQEPNIRLNIFSYGEMPPAD